MKADVLAQAPSTIKMLPYGNPFYGRDGRGPWILRDQAHAERVLAFTKEVLGRTDMVIDYDHATALLAPQGLGRALAAGWVRTLYLAEDGIWASVEWTQQAKAEIVTRQYRYISPHFRVDKVTGEVTRIVNAALTNTPNLDLPALAACQCRELTEEERAICAAMGIPDADFITQKGQRRLAHFSVMASAATSEEREILERLGISETDYLATKAGMARSSGVTSEEKDVIERLGISGTDYLVTKAKMDRSNAVTSEERDIIERLGISGTDYLATKARMEHSSEVTSEERDIIERLGLSETDYLATKARMERSNAVTSEERDIIERLGISETDYLATKAKMAR